METLSPIELLEKEELEKLRFIEFERYEEEDEISYLDSYTVEVTPTDWTAETIFFQINKGNIDLNPAFQRRVAWNTARQSKLIESIIMSMPIPPIVLAVKKESKGKFIVVDGKQRLTSIYNFFKDNLPLELNHKPDTINRNQLLIEIQSKTFSQLNETIRARIENATLRTVIVKNWDTDDILYDIFYRLNSGSLLVNPQELRKSINIGDFTTYLEEITSEKDNHPLRSLHGMTIPNSRMIDFDIVLRYLSIKHYSNSYTGNLKKFLDESIVKFNNSFNDNSIKNKIIDDVNKINDLIEIANRILGTDVAFTAWKDSKSYSRFNKAIFDALLYYISNDLVYDKINNNNSFDREISSKYKEIFSDSEFVRSIEVSTKTKASFRKRFETIKQIFESSLSITLQNPFDV